MRAGWKALELDGEVLLFDRVRGTNVLVTNESRARSAGARHACCRSR